MDSLLKFLPFSVPISVSLILGSVITVLLSFLILSFPLRLLIRYSQNYKIAMRCRQASDIMLVFIILAVEISALSSGIQTSTIMAGNNAFWAAVVTINVSFLIGIPFYLIVTYFVGRVKFYNESHVKYMDYFILYLRSFKDDNKNGKLERKLLHSLNRLYATFAIGRPDEFMPSRGAKRIYVGANWQQVVLELMHKAPIILMRVNTSENFLWEFDQCIKRGYLGKALFWVSDVQSYHDFKTLAIEKYGLEFPAMGENLEHDVLFYTLPDGGYHLYLLEDDSSYHRFANVYLSQHTSHRQQNTPYFYGRNMLLPLAFSPVYSSYVMPGINRWSWVGFIFPDFFIILQSFKWRILIYVIYVALVPAVLNFVSSATGFMGIIVLANLLLGFLVGRNGRTVAWLSRKWESVSFYNRVYRRANYLAVFLGILRLVFWIAVAVFTAVNPWGWNIDNVFKINF